MKSIWNMKEYKSKKSIMLYILIASVALIISVSGCISQKPEKTTPTVTETPLTTEINISATSNASGPSPGPVSTVTTSSPTIKCELCHTNPQNLTPHVNGGKLCINCHGSQVHNIHIGEGTVNLDCKTCHGFPPTIPTVQKGTGPGTYSVCEQCHAPPPDNTKPSNGNLIIIHLSRGKYCTNCHGTDIGAIHAGIIANASTFVTPQVTVNATQ